MERFKVLQSSIIVSIFLHAIVITLGIFGLPKIQRTFIDREIPMVVEVVPTASATNLSSTKDLQEKPIKRKIKKPDSLSVVSKKKVSVPERAFEKERVIVPVPSLPKPKQKVKPIKKPKMELKAHKNLIKAKPRRKPKPPDRFAMVLKNLEKDFRKPVSKKKSKIEPDFMTRLSKSLSERPANFDPTKRITISERNAMINLVKRKMEPCWNFQAGSKKAQDIIVAIKVKLRPDGHVLGASITNRSVLNSDPFKLAAAESALRAVLNPSCQPYNLPTNRYDVWKDLKLTFNPREMLGR